MSVQNLLAWSLQIALLVVIAAAAVRALRLRIPGARLLYWQVVLAISLALPLIGPWRTALSTTVDSVSAITISRTTRGSQHHRIPVQQTLPWLWAAGILTRGLWLVAGFWRLREYRKSAQPMSSREGAELCLSEAVSSPVTFGFLRPVVLLPAEFPQLAPEAREAILRHELLHVRRRDWLFTVAEEVVRAFFWFHPAIWWLLAEIALAREQEVDRQVVASTMARAQYVDALLAIAGAHVLSDVVPASLFLRKRHLKQRVISILKEVRMSKTRLVSSFAAALSILAAACWLAGYTFPLSAAPQAVSDASDGNVIHVLAPPARQPFEQNTVTLQARVDSGGNVIDAQVLAGPDQLRKLALQNVLNSHRPTSAAEHTEQLSVVFEPETGPLSTINISGVSDQVRADLLAKLPVHEGDMLGPEQIAKATQVAHDFGLGVVSVRLLAQGARALVIGPAPASILIGGNVQAKKIRIQPKPTYPAEAKQARIEGVVQLHALIGKDGTVDNLSVISGNPVLAPSALQAVRQWVYEPTLLNGEPVAVETEIDVNYTLLR